MHNANNFSSSEIPNNSHFKKHHKSGNLNWLEDFEVLGYCSPQTRSDQARLCGHTKVVTEKVVTINDKKDFNLMDLVLGKILISWRFYKTHDLGWYRKLDLEDSKMLHCTRTPVKITRNLNDCVFQENQIHWVLQYWPMGRTKAVKSLLLKQWSAQSSVASVQSQSIQ